MEKESKEANELVEQLGKVREEIENLKQSLSSLNKDKELWFKKKSDISKDITDKISELKGTKNKRNHLTKSVKDLKLERDNLNTQIKNLISELKQSKASLDEERKKTTMKGSPILFKKEIEKLEFTLETNPMSFAKEQKIMKQIKDLKKKHDEFGVIIKLMDDVRDKSKEIDKLKKKANGLHKKIQEIAGESQTEHEGLIESSKEIDSLKEKEEEAREKFSQYKKQYSEVNAQLKARIDELKALKSKLGDHDVEEKKERYKQDLKVLKKKEVEVEEKLKKKQKLTTEDLLVLQAKAGSDDFDMGTTKKDSARSRRTRKTDRKEKASSDSF
ncbi:hypothetical protein JW868_04085 [Candidatus Woesearchaeota archaeon]|nr:hypothetical protein [Candidatus Woesearchaeota archaeon]